MNKIKGIFLFSVILLFLLGGCFDPPDDFVSPTWDTKINIPVTSKNFSLMELIEEDSSIFKISNSHESMGLIYVGDTQKVSTINIDDQLKISGFNARATEKIGELKITTPPPVTAEISLDDLGAGVVAGQTAPFPEVPDKDITIDIEGVKTVESAKMESGNFKLSILNNLPVEIQLKGIKLINVDDNSVVAEKPANEIVTIEAKGEATVNFDLSNKTITKSLKYVGAIYSPGSNLQPVEIPVNKAISLEAAFENLVISEATAPLPSQKFEFNQAFALTDSTRITEAVINTGSGTITINNNMDIELNALVSFDNLVNSSGESYELNIDIGRREQGKVITLDLPNWKVVSKTTEPTDSLKYSVKIVSDSTGQLSTITKNDDISFAINFSDLTFKSFSGLLKPSKIVLDKEGFGMDYGDVMSNLDFGEIVFKDCKFKINFNSTAQVPVFINGTLFATNGITSNTMAISEIDISQSGPNQIDVTDLINGFSDELPDSFAIEGVAKVNPNYEVVTVSAGDSIYGDVEFVIPLNIGIPQGTFKDTFNINLGDLDDDKIDNFNFGEITMEVENALPIGIQITATVVDSLNKPILNLPTEYNNMDYLEIPKPTVSSEGDVVSPSLLEQKLTIKGGDIQKFLKNPNMIVNIEFSTAGDNGQPVKFKTSNNITVKIKANAEHKVEL